MPSVSNQWCVIIAGVEINSTDDRSQRSGLPTTSRPAEIALWIQNARKAPINVDNAAAFARKWWQWWDAMNPPWRTRVDGRPQRGGSGEWDCLLKSGPNGFLSVLASLVALQEAADISSWQEAMQDVSWVLQEVVLAATADPTRYACLPFVCSAP